LSQVPDNDVNNFPTAFQTNRLIEAFQQVQIRVETDSPNVTEVCQVHPTQQLAIYCETCKKQLCRDSVLMTQEHASHEYGFFEKVAPKNREKVISKLSQIKAQKSSISSALGEVAAAESSMADNAQKCQDDVEHVFEEMISVLQTCKQAMKDEATAYYSSLTGVFDQQKERLKDIQSKIESVVTSVDTTLQDDDQGFLVRLESTFERINSLQKRIQGTSLAVAKPQLIATQAIGSDALKKFMETKCFLYKKAQAEMCSLDSSFSDVKLYVGKQASFILNLCDSRGNSCQGENGININLVNLRVATCTIRGNFELLQSGRAKIFFTPEIRGRYQMNVKVNGDHIKNNPFTVTVYVHPNLLSKPVAEITGLSRPGSLRCSRDKVLATEVGKDRIIEIDSLLNIKECKKLPGTVELTQDLDHNLYVTDDQSHQLIKLKSTGSVIKVVGQLGKGNTEFNFPNGLRVNKNDELYVCDSYNNRVQVFDLDLNFKRSFGKKGTGRGQFNFPADVNFDSAGNIYVTDNSNHRIQVFSSHSERHIHTIQGDETFKPVSLFIHGNHMYVTDCGHHEVRVIDTESREFISKFGNGYLSKPEGITIDKDGFVYVTSHYSKIIIF
jgi:tripartite motif-containing protein 2/3/tripartite motif-containing protein 71